jgi:hypothetical protein
MKREAPYQYPTSRHHFISFISSVALTTDIHEASHLPSSFKDIHEASRLPPSFYFMLLSLYSSVAYQAFLDHALYFQFKLFVNNK